MYLFYQKTYSNLGAGDDILTIGMNRAVDRDRGSSAKRAARGERGGVSTLKELGEHPANGEKISVLKGRYGPYIKFGKKNVTLPKGTEVESFTLEDAVKLLPAAGGKKESRCQERESTSEKIPLPKRRPSRRRHRKKAAAKKRRPKNPQRRKKLRSNADWVRN